jgi:class 3 adenylate cyclase
VTIPDLASLHAIGAAQQPSYPDAAAVDAAVSRLRTAPPLVFAGECDELKDKIALASRGEAFLLQGGDCAETFAGVTADNVRGKLRVLLQMAVVLTYAASVPVIKVGRLAGQYAKPRSSDTETREVDGEPLTLPAYRGDAVNGYEFTPESRIPDPQRLVEVYNASAAPLNLIRPFVGGRMYAVHARIPEFYRQVPHRPAWMNVAFNPERRCFMPAVDGKGEFAFHTQLLATEHEDRVSEADAVAMVQLTIGLPLKVEGIARAPWTAGHSLVAEKFGMHNVFIGGDAAHLFTPMGGLGYNTGIEDAVNLGWKLAAVLKGVAAAKLLASYEAERRPLAVRNMSSDGLPVRLGVNLGPVRLVKDLNGQMNIIGDGINVAQRVMSFADPGQLLVSRSFYEVVSCLSRDYMNLFRHEGSRTDKHVREHEVYSVVGGAPMARRVAQTESMVHARDGGWLAGMGPLGLRRAALLARIAAGDAPLVIGTHALFQEEVAFQRLALVIVDEQHRFGVHQRLALREKGAEAGWQAHQLIMTATPIPRTLAMTAYADLDVSVIDELPPGRKPVETVAVPEARRAEVVERVAAACREGRQVYWVCPLVEESELLQCQAAEETAERLAEALPEQRIGLIHGRMKPDEKDRIMRAFEDARLDILVATTVIEVGVDVPNASLMIIENAERLGLAQLHQLRGRVGRGSAKSSCLLFYRGPLTETARSRLEAMRETSDGFEIARRDLELRGPGELLGTRQTGIAELRVADLARDAELLPAVAAAADRLLAENAVAARALVQRWHGHGERYAGV